MKSLRKALLRHTPKFSCLHACFGNAPFILLDIGSGNHSPSKTRSIFPNCQYHGVDMDKYYNNDERDINAMHAFYELDLTSLNFDIIPNNHFDFIRMTHVIEHLKNGDQVIVNLLPKLKVGGYIYIEYPGIKSTKLPSMTGTLNFYDDATHVRIYSVPELRNLLQSNKLKVLQAGTRRNLLFLSAMPFRIINGLLKNGKLQGNYFWDLLGFAEFVFAKK